MNPPQCPNAMVETSPKTMDLSCLSSDNSLFIKIDTVSLLRNQFEKFLATLASDEKIVCDAKLPQFIAESFCQLLEFSLKRPQLQEYMRSGVFRDAIARLSQVFRVDGDSASSSSLTSRTRRDFSCFHILCNKCDQKVPLVNDDVQLSLELHFLKGGHDTVEVKDEPAVAGATATTTCSREFASFSFAKPLGTTFRGASAMVTRTDDRILRADFQTANVGWCDTYAGASNAATTLMSVDTSTATAQRLGPARISYTSSTSYRTSVVEQTEPRLPAYAAAAGRRPPVKARLGGHSSRVFDEQHQRQQRQYRYKLPTTADPHCEACCRRIPEPMIADHATSMGHLKHERMYRRSMELLRQNQSYVTILQKAAFEFYCSLCLKQQTGKNCFIQHCLGREHLQNKRRVDSFVHE